MHHKKLLTLPASTHISLYVGADYECGICGMFECPAKSEIMYISTNFEMYDKML